MDKHVYLIGNAHLDPIWQWQWQEGFAEIKATYRSALDRMNEFPDYIFTSACAAYYEWIKESDPAMFEEIRRRVAEGRWVIVGGWYIQPDCNLPSGESFARHALISQRFFRDEFGQMAKTGYNVDSFGHNGSIPMLLRQSRMENYVFMRPMAHEKTLESDLFVWESADGSRVTTYRVHPQYNISVGIFQTREKCMEVFRALGDEAERKGEPNMAFYGIGNHGGGATVALLTDMHENLDGRYIYSSPDAFFDAVAGFDLPTLNGDLQFHAKGCYSVCSMIKANNRASENRIGAAECFSVLSKELVGTEYPSDKFLRAWKNLLFDQFHDILGGCSIKAAYDDAAQTHGEVRAIADRAINFACQQISWNIDTSAGVEPPDQWSFAWKIGSHGAPIVVFNPHPWAISTLVRTNLNPISEVYDVNGRALQLQRVRAARTDGVNTHESAFIADIPALGYAVFTTATGTAIRDIYDPFKVGAYSVENEYIRLTFDKDTGEVSEFFDKQRNAGLLNGRTDAVMIDETEYDTWAHGASEFRKRAETFVGGSVHLLEAGPVKVTFRSERSVTTDAGLTTVRRDYTMLAGSDVVTVRTVVDFHAHHRMLKFTFPTAVEAPKVICEIPFGHAERPDDGSEQVCGSWFAAHGADGNGLAVLNDSKYSFSADGAELSLTVLRGAIYLDHYAGTHRDEFCEYQDQGVHEFTYALTPFGGVAGTVRRAAELNRAPFRVTETFHAGNMPREFSGISVSADNIIVTAVKKHEDSDAVTIRAYECEGIDTDVKFKVFGKEFEARFGHNAVKTFRVDPDGAVTETDFIEALF